MSPDIDGPVPAGIDGLTSAEVEQRIAEGKINVSTELKTKSVRELVIKNTCTLFNLINLVLAVLVVLTGSIKNLTFLGIVVLNTGIGIVQALRSKRMVDKLTLLTSKRAQVVRDGALVELDLDQIVLDDIVRLGRGDQIPADSVVAEGEAQVNESLLTGESDLIRKLPGSELMSGSFVDSGTVCARAARGCRQLRREDQQRGEVRQEGQLRDHACAERHRALREHHHASPRYRAVRVQRP